MDASGLLKIVDSVLDDLIVETGREKPSNMAVMTHILFCKNAIALADVKTVLERDRAPEEIARRSRHG